MSTNLSAVLDSPRIALEIRGRKIGGKTFPVLISQDGRQFLDLISLRDSSLRIGSTETTLSLEYGFYKEEDGTVLECYQLTVEEPASLVNALNPQHTLIKGERCILLRRYPMTCNHFNSQTTRYIKPSGWIRVWDTTFIEKLETVPEFKNYGGSGGRAARRDLLLLK